MISNLLKKKILLLDGAMGTSIHRLNLDSSHYGGIEYEGCNEWLNISNPGIIQKIHEDYLEAGADIIETNTFSSNDITLSEYGLQDKGTEINKAAVNIGKAAIKKYSTKEWPRFLAGSIGPTNKTISVSGNVIFEELEKAYYCQAKALYEAGVDLFIIETCFDTSNAKAALIAIDCIFKEKGKKLPIILSATIERNGTMLAGQDIEAFYTSMQHFDLLAIGINCALGPDLMIDHIRTLSNIAKTNIICYPNAGLPLEDGTFPLKPKEFAKLMSVLIENRWVNIIGGCCGTTNEHIVELKKIINLDNNIRTIPDSSIASISGVEVLAIEDQVRPILIGERTSVIGSKKFKDLISNESFDMAAEIGKNQVIQGAQVLDICLANPDRDEGSDTNRFFDIITKKVKVPLMIDSTSPGVIEGALKRTQGKSIINSINFEDGTERIVKIMPLVKKYGAMVIFGTIDEDKSQAMAITVEKKIQIAKRAYKYLTEEWNLSPHDIIFDMLVFPIASGDKKYSDSAKISLEAIKRIKEELPLSKTVLGISNVSFGLPILGREVLNSVYLYHATKAGLDFAIVNSEKIMRYPSISEEEKKLAENMLFLEGDDPLGAFVEFYRGKKTEVKNIINLPLDDRLATYIIEGRKDGLIEDLDIALASRKHLEIINDPLMKGMNEVGRLFNENKLIISEVLQSAESMKFAVNHLEKFMEKSDIAAKGKVIIATVKGDVHDIGKNIFEIILKNNGYQVINLGIKVPPEKLIEEFHKHKPDVIGLSGLLVKSAHMMVTTVEDFKTANIDVPIVVSGAALTEKFTFLKIAKAYNNIVAYAKDAMNGLSIVKEIIEDKNSFANKNLTRSKEILRAIEIPQLIGSDSPKNNLIIKDVLLLKVPDLDQHIIEDHDLVEIFNHVDYPTLYNIHLGLNGLYDDLMNKKDDRAIKITNQVNAVKKLIIENKLIKPMAIYQFFECNSEGNSVKLYKDEQSIEILEFPRQKDKEKLCISDFIAPRDKGRDTIGMFVVTCGKDVIKKAKELSDNHEYVTSIIYQFLALESAEAFAEIVHKKMLKLWGIQPDHSNKNKASSKKQGIRISYGFPECPNLEEQTKLFKILRPEQIGITLTESFMMDPEASVSGIVLYHPQATHFSL